METRYTHLSDPSQPGALDPRYYKRPQAAAWTGRNDGSEPEHRRWHQVMKPLDLLEQHAPLDLSTVFLGFACDEGVRRNSGRIGAAAGPDFLRPALANMPTSRQEIRLWDAGDIHCPDGNLESAQEQLGLAVASILELGARPIVLGGGHEITYGHFLGLNRHLFQPGSSQPGSSQPGSQPKTKLGIVNFDAHFDNRRPGSPGSPGPSSGPSSGTGFWQIEEAQKALGAPFHYLAIGIQPAANTVALFDQADRSGSVYLTAEELRRTPAFLVPSAIEQFIETVDALYLTIDLDVFAAAYAPGVSAPSPFGLLPDQSFFNCLDRILSSGKLVSVDLAEFNPGLDPDQRTAKLTAALLHHVLERWVSP